MDDWKHINWIWKVCELPLEKADLVNKLIDWGASYSAEAWEEGSRDFWFLLVPLLLQRLSRHWRQEYQKSPMIRSTSIMRHKAWEIWHLISLGELKPPKLPLKTLLLICLSELHQVSISATVLRVSWSFKAS